MSRGSPFDSREACQRHIDLFGLEGLVPVRDAYLYGIWRPGLEPGRAYIRRMAPRFRDLLDENKTLGDEVFDTPFEIIEDVADGNVGTAVKKTIATPVRIARNFFDYLDDLF